MRRLLLAAALALAIAGCSDPGRVDAADYDAFWLWAGVAPPPALDRARTVYLLDGEVRAGERSPYVELRPAPPNLASKQVWLVVRTDTLRWPQPSHAAILRNAERWAARSPGFAGVQLDFDARTRHLGEYAHFLADFRRRLPPSYLLSVTGLLDWSANGDPQALAALRGTVDEVVIQTYQGRETIPGYDAYFERMRAFPLPFRVGLVQGGRWREPAGLSSNPNFRGYVVFLLEPRG